MMGIVIELCHDWICRVVLLVLLLRPLRRRRQSPTDYYHGYDAATVAATNTASTRDTADTDYYYGYDHGALHINDATNYYHWYAY